MKTIDLVLSEDDLKEIFALFSSPTDEERAATYDPTSGSYYRAELLGEEYSLTEEKKEFAVDAWREVSYFLYRHGYSLRKGGIEIDLPRSSGYAVEDSK
jgi:hypothetical protein